MLLFEFMKLKLFLKTLVLVYNLFEFGFIFVLVFGT